MDAAKRRRASARTSFTKALKSYYDSINATLPNSAEISVSYTLLENRMVELNAVQERFMELLIQDTTVTEIEIEKEQDEAEVYQRKYLMAQFQEGGRREKLNVTPSPSVQYNETKQFRLPKIEVVRFDGAIRNWLKFWSFFKKIDEDTSLCKEDKFQYLVQSMVPGSRAADLVNSYPPTEENYGKVVLSLKNRFGREDLQIEVYVRELLQLVLQNVIKADKLPLCTLYDRLDSYLRALESLGVTTDKCAALLYPLVESSLPEDLLRTWQRHETDQHSSSENIILDAALLSKNRLNRLLKFLAAEVEGESKITLAMQGFDLDARKQDTKEKPKTAQQKKNIPSATDLFVGKSKVLVCFFCESKDHESKNCSVASKWSLQQRQERASAARACYCCLKPGHPAKFCRVAVKCTKCHRKHVDLMCRADQKGISSEHNLASVSNPEVLLKTLKVILKVNTREIPVRVLIDDGSQNSYIKSDLAKKLGLKSLGDITMNHVIFGGGQLNSVKHHMYQIKLQSVSGDVTCNFKVLDQELICGNVPPITPGLWCQELEKHGIILSDLYNDEQEISVLIGADIAGKLCTGRLIQFECGLTAVETLLGWTVLGKVPGSERRESAGITAISLYVKNATIKDLWELDVLGIKDPIERKSKLECAEDTHLMKLIQDLKNNVSVNNFCPENLARLKASFYVDNCVTSLNSRDELHQFIRDSKDAMALGGFDLRGWEFTGDGSIDSQVPLLGLIWNKSHDSLSLTSSRLETFDSESKVTKRVILSSANRIFDPLGFVSPVMLVPKLLLQEAWSRKFNWDEEVGTDLRDRFIKWSTEVEKIAEIQVPRCFLGGTSVNAEVSLHTFCDASKLAYAAVSFLRVRNNDTVSVSFVQSKTRVAPVKGTVDSRHSIPRLELLAATIGVRLTKSIIDALKIQNVRVFYWSDSSTVLAWIKRRKNWGTFVYNRFKEIREFSDASNWQHIPGQLNPADLPSRGCSVSHFLTSRWWQGPQWLKDSQENWPVDACDFDESEINKELKKSAPNEDRSIVLLNSNTGKSFLEDFSSYSKLLRIFSLVLRFIGNCRKETSQRVGGSVSVSEIENAEVSIMKLVQEECNIDKNNLKQLEPYFDGKVIRVKSKIVMRDDSFEFRCPIVVPGNHHVVRLLIQEKHESVNHAGTQITLNAIREKFWILGGRKSIRSVIASCKACRRYDARPLTAKRAPLPINRVRDAAVFEVIGIDFAGPIYLKGDKKVWICIFTCAVFRAIHLEIVSGLDVSSFLMALRRHIARRGKPKVIYSDNGTNFVGLKNALKRIDYEKISRVLATKQIEWICNPPLASWWGGFWERLIGILKGLLRRTLKHSCLNYEEMLTVLTDCEAIMNDRPITFVSDNDQEFMPLTPSHFLREITEIGVLDLDEIEKNDLGKRYRYRLKIKEDLRQRFRVEYLGTLINYARNKHKTNTDLNIGDIVLMGSDNMKRMNWPLARVKELIRGKDGHTRVVRLVTPNGEVVRPIQRIYPLEARLNSDIEGDESSEVCITKNRKVVKNYELQEQNAEIHLNKDKSPIVTRRGRTIKKPSRFV